MIALFFFIILAWFLWLLYSFRNDFQKIIFLVTGVLLQIFGAYLIFQDGINADEQGTGGDIFGNPNALLLSSPVFHFSKNPTQTIHKLEEESTLLKGIIFRIRLYQRLEGVDLFSLICANHFQDSKTNA